VHHSLLETIRHNQRVNEFFPLEKNGMVWFENRFDDVNPIDCSLHNMFYIPALSACPKSSVDFLIRHATNANDDFRHFLDQ
jgi:hypothetical protein